MALQKCPVCHWGSVPRKVIEFYIAEIPSTSSFMKNVCGFLMCTSYVDIWGNESADNEVKFAYSSTHTLLPNIFWATFPFCGKISNVGRCFGLLQVVIWNSTWKSSFTVIKRWKVHLPFVAYTVISWAINFHQGTPTVDKIQLDCATPIRRYALSLSCPTVGVFLISVLFLSQRLHRHLCNNPGFNWNEIPSFLFLNLGP